MRAITIAFVRLPELVQGIILTLASAASLAWPLQQNAGGDGAGIVVPSGAACWYPRLWHVAVLRETEDKLYNEYRRCWKGAKS
ncbi:hypothetical protein ACNKHS_13475 [Shigella flexneri]